MAKQISNYAVRNRETGLKRRARTRARLIEAAIEVVLDRGVEAPVIDDFITTAEISRGSFYNYFQTKEELLEAVGSLLRQELSDTYGNAKSRISDPAERLIGGVRYLIRSSRDNPKLGLLLLRMPTTVSGAEVEFRRGPTEDVKECIAKGVLPVQNVDVAVDLITGAATEAIRVMVSLHRPKDYAEQVATLLLTALGMKPALAASIAQRPFHDLGLTLTNLGSES